MIGVDTNVLLRFALKDDRRQSPTASDFLRDGDRRSFPAVICPVVMVEFVWTLRRREGFSKEEILGILDALTESESIVYSDSTLITTCIERWRHGQADLPDYIIAALNLQAGAETTVTFDTDAAKEPGFALLPS